MSDTPDLASRAYLFGDSDLASARLRLLAQVFEPSSRAFLSRLPGSAPRRIADLGCGPGYTTGLLAETFPKAHVLGLDNSAAYIEQARQVVKSGVEFQQADALAPLPSGPFDLIYCRYLLTHVPRATDAIAGWAGQLNLGGRIAVEENEWILSERPAFSRYLSIVEAMLAEGGKQLYLGAELHGWQHERVSLASSELVSIAISDRDAADMFRMNVPAWREQPFVRAHWSPREIDALHEELAAIAASDSPASSIVFGRRRIVFRRRD